MTGGAARGRILLALAACLLGACASARSAREPVQVTETRQVRLKVPFFPDRTDQCGPSALASVLGYWGKPEAPAGLREEIYRARLKGSLTVDLLLAAQSRGLTAELAHTNLDRAKRELDAGRPVIAFVNTGYRLFPIGHYMVLTGYDDRRGCVLVHSGKARDREIPYAKFDRLWNKTGGLGLLIFPPHDARSWTSVGNAAFTEERLDQAEAAFRKALEHAPGDPTAANNLAMTLLQSGGSLREAEILALGALESTGPLRPYVLDTLAQIRQRQAKAQEAP